jgi:hypothetical protein
MRHSKSFILTLAATLGCTALAPVLAKSTVACIKPTVISVIPTVTSVVSTFASVNPTATSDTPTAMPITPTTGPLDPTHFYTEPLSLHNCSNLPISSGPNSITPVGVLKGLSDSALLDVIQRQTFRYFWHYAHPVSGLARERDNTVKAEYYWDYINEAYDEPNFSRHTFGEEACAIGGNYRSRPIWRLFRNIPDIRIVLEKVGFQSPSINQ